MSESIAQEQKRTKPLFENIIATRASMSNEEKEVASAFLAYCNAKNITYKWSSTNRWTLKAKSKTIGYICIGVRSHDDNSWRILLDLKELLQYEDFIQKEGLAEIICNNVNYCERCNHKNPCFGSATILGKVFSNICGVCVSFKNPDTKALDNALKIIDFRLALSHGTANRPIFDLIIDGLTRIDNKLRVSGISDLEGNTDENRDNLFNSKYNNYFYAGPYEHMSTGDSHNIVFELDNPVELKMYSLITGLRIDVPNSWELYGATSKDGAWTLIDSQTEFPKPVTLYTERAFRIDTPKAYQYYRITLDGSYFVLSQIHLYTNK
jgi:hypothetical protein